MVITKQEVFQQIAHHRAQFEAFGVERFGIFGSFVHGTQTNASDVDLLVVFKPGKKSFDNFMRLGFFLEDVLGRNVDLVTPESLSPHVGPRVLGEVEYGTNDA